MKCRKRSTAVNIVLKGLNLAPFGTHAFEIDPVVDALEQALWSRSTTVELVHHIDRGCQYLSIHYTEKLAEAGIKFSVGSIGDSYDNALAETINGLYKAEVIQRRGPWKTIDEVEFATLEWVDWFNNRRLLEPIGSIPPAKYKLMHYQHWKGHPKPHDSHKKAFGIPGAIHFGLEGR